MFSLTRRRREAERNKKLEESFREADVDNNGYITREQMKKIFEVNEIQVANLDEEITKLAGKDGHVKFGEFMRFAQGTDLHKVEYQDRVFHRVEEPEHIKPKQKSQKDSSSKAAVDRVEIAFRKFDTNGDGYLSRDEFDLMMKDVDKRQAERIFRSCDRAGDGRISLDEFKAIMQRGTAAAKKQ